MMPSDYGSRRAASGGALERRKTATARRSRTAANIQSVLRVRRCMKGRQEERITPGWIGLLMRLIHVRRTDTKCLVNLR